jgi:cytoskeletal protein RodZ
MSLINDALKRAQESQQNNPPEPPSVSALRPVEDDRHRGPGLGLLLSLILMLLIVATGILLLQWMQMNRKTSGATQNAGEPAASSLALPAVSAAPARKTEPPPTTPEPQTSVQAPPPPVVSAPVAAPAEPVPVATPVAPPPAKLEFKLQGISYQPGRSTAVINGKSVHTGDRLGEARITAITAESVTLVSAGQTNVLTFGEPY